MHIQSISEYHFKILLDFMAKVAIRNERLHETSNVNRLQ
jgi:hypothetical protein